MENESPDIFEVLDERQWSSEHFDDAIIDEIDCREIFDQIRCIRDPEHPVTLEELNVVKLEDIILTGLCICVKLRRCLTPSIKISVEIAEGTHQNEHLINKQLNDKERVIAAMDNPHLRDVVNSCLSASDPPSTMYNDVVIKHIADLILDK
ncbi:hypothetical protein GJ496_008602 [Pomphorhynchus laevis]|nr:hypothetical protein GJ496_008602 [Pomphorhynchus laevis]